MGSIPQSILPCSILDISKVPAVVKTCIFWGRTYRTVKLCRC